MIVIPTDYSIFITFEFNNDLNIKTHFFVGSDNKIVAIHTVNSSNYRSGRREWEEIEGSAAKHIIKEMEETQQYQITLSKVKDFLIPK